MAVGAVTIVQASYFVAAALFIFGLKRMSSPVTARGGIVWAGAGMVVAVLVSLAFAKPDNPDFKVNLALILLALAIGNAWAWWQGKRVPMTAMLQMVALFNGMGGGSAALIAAAELYSAHTQGYVDQSMALLGLLIGAVSFSGSIVAWAKLDGKMNRSIRFGGQKIVNMLVLLATLAAGLWILAWLSDIKVTVVFLGALLFGVLMTIPIGGVHI